MRTIAATQDQPRMTPCSAIHRVWLVALLLVLAPAPLAAQFFFIDADTLQSLETMDLTNCGISDTMMESLGKLENLQILVLVNNPLTSRSLKHLPKNLRELYIINCRLYNCTAFS